MSSVRACVLVLGMHHSEMSVLARVLGLLGAALPQIPLPPALRGDDSGSHETLKFAATLDAMQVEANSQWLDWQKLDLTGLPPDRLVFYKTELIRQIHSEYGDEQIIILHEPGLCRFAQFLIEVLGEAGFKTYCLLPLRNPLAVIARLVQRDQISADHAGLLWLRHILDAEAASRTTPRASMSYEALLDDSQAAVRSISRNLKIDWPRSIDGLTEEVGKFLDIERRHLSHSVDDLGCRGEITAWVQDAYAALLRVEADPYDRHAVAELDRIGSEFELVSKASSDFVNLTVADYARSFRASSVTPAEAGDSGISGLDRDHSNLNAELDRPGAKSSETPERWRDDELQLFNDRVREILASSPSELRIFPADSEVSVANVARLNHQMRKKSARVGYLYAVLGYNTAAVEDARKLIERLTKQAEAAKVQFAQQSQEMGKAKAQIARQSHEIDNSRAHFAQQARDIERSRAQLLQQAREIEKSQALLAASAGENDELRRLLSRSQTDARELQAEVSDRTSRLEKCIVEVQAVRRSFLNSSSWRLTIPLRWVRKTFGRASGSAGLR